LLYYGINSWFIKVSSIREKLVELNKGINWYPSHIKDGRFGKWLEGAKDWSLSRLKFWGTPLPVWKNVKDPEDIIVVGSKDELEKLSGKKLKDFHKPEIDKIKIVKDGKTYERVSDVIDCWYDSGSASFAQFHYPFENKKEFDKRFPYDFISEAIDQTRGWFYTLHVLAVALFDKPAYKNVICAGHVVDDKGEKMSKSKGNIIKPRDIIDKTGVDAVRLQFCTSDAGSQKRFSYDLMKESVMPFLNVLYNCESYYKQAENKKCSMKIEDKWILSRLNSTIKEVTEDLNNFELNKPYEKIQNFVSNDFSRGYIKMTRDREDTKEIIGEVLEKVSLMLAPFAPYISEYIYSNFSKESVHLSSWPKAEDKKINKNLESIFEQSLQIIEKGLAERDKNQIGLKWPLSKTVIYIKGSERFEDVEELIKTQLNVKKILFKSPAEKGTELTVELDTKLTPELESEGYARELSRTIQAFRKELGLNKKDSVRVNIHTDEEFKKIIDDQKNFIRDRTNSKKLEIVTTLQKENFKNITNFRIRDRKGVIEIITTD
jgi:isoleucyl-tRNA synthetase